MVASNYDSDVREEDNVIQNKDRKLRTLKSAVIYGANASGKSKLHEALAFMKRFVITSSQNSQIGDPIGVDPFRLNIETEVSPSEFEVLFFFDNVRYRYGFEIDKKQVVAEWLFQKPKTKEIELFYREYQDIDFHSTLRSKGRFLHKEGAIRNNVLLLSVTAQFNDEISSNVISWFKGLRTISGLRPEGYEAFTMHKVDDPEYKQKILQLLNAADISIDDLQLQMQSLNDISKELSKELPIELREKLLEEVAEEEEDPQFMSDVLTTHKKYDSNSKHVGIATFSMQDDESSGTHKFFALTGPILDTLERGYILLVDELDSKLHPNLVCRIVALFNSKESNPKNAQLIFNTHDTNLLSSGLFRRDQIWFTEKDKLGAAKLFSLGDFSSKEVRKNEAFEDNYIRGKYGAVPYLGFFDELSIATADHENEK